MALKFDPFTSAVVPAAGSEKFKDPVATSGSLPATGNNTGDVRYVIDAEALYAWDGAAWILITSPPGSGSFQVDTFTLNGTDITNKYVVLSTVPATAAKTVLLPEGGPNQIYSSDFQVTADDGGKRLSWSGLGLDGILESGEVITVLYS